MLRNLLVAVLLCGVLSAHSQAPAPKKNAAAKDTAAKADYHTAGTPMPRVKLVTMDTLAKLYSEKKLKKINKKNRERLGYTPLTRVYTNDDLNDGSKLLLMIFNPTCGHCEDMTDYFEKNIARLHNAKLVLVANPVTKAYVPDFIRIHKVKDYYPDIIVGLDSSKIIDNAFLYSALPQVSIYDKDRKLLKIYSGDVLIDSFEQYLR